MFPGSSAAKRATVLVVEDDESLRMLYRTALTAAGFAVVAVEDGLDALRHIDMEVPSIVVLDLGLPRLAGRDVQREIAAHVSTQRVPIVVVSGSDTSDLNPADFACVLRKPFDPEALVDAVRNCLAR